MNELRRFNFESEEIRAIKKGSIAWLVAKDVCKVLEIKNNRDALKDLNESEKLVSVITTSGQRRKLTFVNESGVYALILKSRKPETQKLRFWVTSEVLPAIQKTGRYELPEPKNSPIRIESARIRNQHTKVLSEHEINKKHEYIQLTLATKSGLEIPKDHKKPEYSFSELLKTQLAESLATFTIHENNINGYRDIKPVVLDSAVKIKDLTSQKYVNPNQEFVRELEAMNA